MSKITDEIFVCILRYVLEFLVVCLSVSAIYMSKITDEIFAHIQGKI